MQGSAGSIFANNYQLHIEPDRGTDMNIRTAPATWRVTALAHLASRELSISWEEGDMAQWVEMAAGCGIAEAQMRLGHMLLAGDGIGPDARAAFACFLCAAESADTAVAHYRRTAASGHAGAMNLLGRCHEAGVGVRSDKLLAPDIAAPPGVAILAVPIVTPP